MDSKTIKLPTNNQQMKTSPFRRDDVDKAYRTLKDMAILINADMTVASHMKLKANESKELMRSIYLRLNEMIGEEE
jgi:hypothetical protein|tara:strand:- start:114 stop:341 length:228 start_codon:yes stop_codon:yes gene_type:complete